MSVNIARNPSVVKTALDGVHYQEFNGQQHPGYVTALDSGVFNQDTADSSAVIMEILGGSGAWSQTAEEELFAQGQPRVTNQKTFNVAKWAQALDISREFFDDNKHSTWEKMVRGFATRARTTRDKNAFAAFRLGFTTVLTADGEAWFSNSHTNIAGDTIDNLETAALSDSSLNTLMVRLAEQKAQDGEIDGHVAATLVVPVAKFKTACEITKSEQRSGTANNDINYYSQMYPGLRVVTSPFLGAASGGSDDAFFLLSPNHSLTRWVREGMKTDLIDASISRNDVYTYKGSFREVVGVMSYEGAVASNGTA